MNEVESNMLDDAQNKTLDLLYRIECYLTLARLFQKDVQKCWGYIDAAQDLTHES